ncbi:MAG: hypothetical protein JW836_14575 [Deltaproteobacteria bacterium]|nr:hypothetical protein [Deltaproteobacteria bacterium]
MDGLRRLQEKLDQGSLARLGAALWAKIGSTISPVDLSWSVSLLGSGGGKLLWSTLVEQGVVDREGKVSGVILARMLERLCGKPEEETSDIRVVWTLPKQHPDADLLGSSYREAILQTIDACKRELILSSPFLEESGVNWFTEAVVRALSRNVQITVITHRADDIGSLQSKALENLRREAQDRGKKLTVYSVCEELNFMVHAKIAVSDANTFVVGSANVTGQGLGGHLECGVCASGAQAIVIKSVLARAIGSGMAALVYSTS